MPHDDSADPPLEFDSEEFAANEREAWDSVAPAWRKWWQTFESGAQTLSDRLVTMAGVESGSRVLDIATGIGEPALTAARAAGPLGRVLGCDLSAGMVEMARERAAAEAERHANLAHVTFSVQDAERLDVEAEGYETGSFDATVCRWGLMLMANPAAAVAGAHNALRPDGRFAAAVWAGPEDVPFLATAGNVLRRELGLPAPDPLAPGPFRLQHEDDLPRLLSKNGLREIETDAVSVTMSFPSPRVYALFITEMSSSARKALASATESDIARVLDAIEAAAQPFRVDGETARFENVSRCAVGRR